jgi:hypothetical protein
MTPFILKSVLDVREWSGLYIGRFTPVKKSLVSFKIWVGPRKIVEILDERNPFGSTFVVY